jgi:flagellar hook assembly protein FlgD
VADATPQPALAITNLTATPRKGGELVSWCYTLSREAEVTAQVETLAGRRVAVMEEQTDRGARVNTLAWDGRDGQGQPVPNGVYLVRVVARTEEGESVQAVRTVRIVR